MKKLWKYTKMYYITRRWKISFGYDLRAYYLGCFWYWKPYGPIQVLNIYFCLLPCLLIKFSYIKYY